MNNLRDLSDSCFLDLFCILLYPGGQLHNSTKATYLFLSVIQLLLSIVLFIFYHCDNRSDADLMGRCWGRGEGPSWAQASPLMMGWYCLREE